MKTSFVMTWKNKNHHNMVLSHFEPVEVLLGGQKCRLKKNESLHGSTWSFYCLQQSNQMCDLYLKNWFIFCEICLLRNIERLSNLFFFIKLHHKEIIAYNINKCWWVCFFLLFLSFIRAVTSFWLMNPFLNCNEEKKKIGYWKKYVHQHKQTTQRKFM